jgi:hypothetical protein
MTSGKSKLVRSDDGRDLGADRELDARRRANAERAQRAAAEALRLLRDRRRRERYNLKRAG